MGGIASISAGSKSFDQYVIVRNAKNGSWSLSKPVTLWPQLADSHHIVHLAWNFIGTELAVVDSSGAVSIYQSPSVSLGQMQCKRLGINDNVSDLHSIVGLHWLTVLNYTLKVSPCNFPSLHALTWTPDWRLLVGESFWIRMEL
jgi:mediator of RNA polymerase II transcription subunit 16, fungi type